MIEKTISELYTNELFISICKRYGKDNHEDLRNEVILILLEKPKNILEHIVNNNYLLPYTLQLARWQAMPPRTKNSKGTTFYAKFGKGKTDHIDYTLESSFGDSPEKNGIKKNIYETELISSDEPYNEDYFILAEKISKKILDDALSQDNKYFYNSRIILEKAKYKNIKQLSRATGIPYFSLRDAITKYKEFLKEWAQES